MSPGGPAFSPGPLSGAPAGRPEGHAVNQDGTSPHTDFEIDLTLEETRRRAAVIAALEPGWDPVAVMRSEEEAYDLLYSGLDERQQETYDMLVAAGVLPRRRPGRAAT